MASKKKRKGLMETLSDYQKEKGYGPKKKSNTQIAYGSKQMLQVKPVMPPVRNPPPVSQDKTKEKPPQAPKDSQIRQLAPDDGGKREIKPDDSGKTKEKYKPTTGTVNPNAESEQRRDYAKYNPNTGTYGGHRKGDGPPKPKRSDFPAGSQGNSKYKAAMRAYRNKVAKRNEPEKEKLKVNRRGRRV